MYQESGPKKPLRLERRDVGLADPLGDHVGIARHVGAGRRRRTSRRPCAPCAVRDGLARRSGLPLRNSAFTVLRMLASKPSLRLVEVLLVEELIVPLPGRVLGLRIDRAVDQRQTFCGREAPAK